MESRQRRVTIYMTDEEYRGEYLLLTSLLKLSGLSFSGWARIMIRRTVRTGVDVKPEEKEQDRS
jgi:hypothetical protein